MSNLVIKKPCAIWLTGLSGSGKTTLAKALHSKFTDLSVLSTVLDGDELRNSINKGLGFSDADRTENIRRAAEVSSLFIQSGFVTINAFISPSEQIRDMAKNIIGSNNFILVYLNAPIEICEQRDVKGLYTKAKNGEIAQFTGISAPYEKPIKPNIILDTVNNSVEACVNEVIKYLYKNND
jgi:adenylylsulfate kinase